MRLPLACLLAMASCAIGADFVGSRACAECHSAVYQSFNGTPMAKSSGRVGTGEPKEQFELSEFRDSHGAYAYKVGQDAGSYYFDFRQVKNPGTGLPISGRRQLEYFVGSGSAARSYLFSVDDFLYEAPVAYYRNSGSWKAAPGYADNDFPYLTRPVMPGCLQCHASGIRPVAETQNKYESPPFLEGVGCERCHGPGSEHIATGQAMVNPAKLGSAERDSICEQCHLSGEMRVPKRGKDEPMLRAGDRLADNLTVFVRSGAPSELRVTSHVENLAQSACKRASGDKLWCGSCHDPHSVPSATEKASYFRNKCLTCHQTSTCAASQAARSAKGDDCIACHMPRNPTADVEHVVFTDHSIRRRATTGAGPHADAELAPFSGAKASPRDLALAYAKVGLREDNEKYIERSFQLLQKVIADASGDAEALAYLAQFYRDRKDDAHALPLYERAWQLDHTEYAAGAALGAYQMQRGNLEEAIRLWKETLAISPALVLVRLNLAIALLRAGHTDEARATLQKALEFNPSLEAARNLLEQVPK